MIDDELCTLYHYSPPPPPKKKHLHVSKQTSKNEIHLCAQNWCQLFASRIWIENYLWVLICPILRSVLHLGLYITIYKAQKQESLVVLLFPCLWCIYGLRHLGQEIKYTPFPHLLPKLNIKKSKNFDLNPE